MKYTKMMLAAVALAALTASCGEKKKSQDIIAPRVVEQEPKEPVKMQEYTDERSVEWLGRGYHVAIHRHASDSLPMVKDETGQKFVDNVFTLAVSRGDGSVFFSRRFTKSDLTQYLDKTYREEGVFEGLVFDRVDGDDLVFGGSVGLPQTDEYIPLVIRLSRKGDLSIQRDTQMDTNGDTSEQEPSSEEI